MLEARRAQRGPRPALLGAPGNDVRRRLARDAVARGWSVRETENRVRLASQPKTRPRRAPVDPDAAGRRSSDAADALEAALGHEVTARAKGDGIVVELRFDDVGEAHALARRLRKRLQLIPTTQGPDEPRRSEFHQRLGLTHGRFRSRPPMSKKP